MTESTLNRKKLSGEMETGRAPDSRVRLLADAAAQIEDAEESRSFLEAVCSGEQELLAAVQETLTLAPPERPSRVNWNNLQEGAMVGGRFHLMRRLGEGGMGVVFQARDTKLDELRALKFAKPGQSHIISPEARSALKVTHENICRIHEIHSETSDSGSVDFLSMEFVPGETLSARIRGGPLAQSEALDIARQLCRGLEASHAASILHRDLKSNNVMLSKTKEGGTRAVIMDFGLAHSVEVRTSGPRGTLHYIAPEVWKGEDATAASDVYSLGVVLYEMLTGRMPYPSGTDWKTRLSKLPEAPSRTERKPDARWDPIVLGCLRQDPAQRFPSAAAVSQAIEDAFGGAKRRRLLIAAAILVATLAPVALFRDAIWPPPMARLALLPLAGSTGDVALDSVVRGGLLEVAGRLESLGAESRRLALIPVEESVRHEVKAPGLAAARLGATHVLASEINPKGTAIELRASVVDARTGEVLRNFSGEFQGSDILGVSTSLAAVVTSAFRLKKAPPATMAATAYPHYARGLATIRQQRALFDPAIESFQKALTIDANSPAVQSALANAYLEKFQATNEARWLEEASKLARRAETLHPDTPEVLLVRGRVEELEGRPERGIEFFKRAAELEPNNSEAWRRTGTALQALGRDAEAVSALRRSIELDPGYYNPHLTLGQVHLRAGRYLQAAEEFREAARLAPELPEAYSHLGAGLVLAERLPEAEQALRKSIQLRETRAALNNLSVLLRYQDRHSEAVQVLERALKVGVDSTPLRLNLGNALLRIGRAQDAKVHFTRASELARSTLLRDPRDAVARAQWAHTLVRLGSPSLAADEARQAMRLGSTQYSVLFNSVMTMEALGRREEALAFASEASTEQLKDLRRQPDLAEFSRDPRFLKLIEARGSQSNNANKE